MAKGKETDEKGHFTGQACRIHTSRSHEKCSNAEKGCNHQDNCDHSAHPVNWKKPAQWTWGDEWESHHVLCISCVNRYMVLEAYDTRRREFIDLCYRDTAWCINQAPNLIALPMKLVYQRYAQCRELDLPCHDWDHNNTGGYTDEVTNELHTKLWQHLKELGTEEACKASKAMVFDQLTELSSIFQQTLRDRGKRIVGGTLAAWIQGQNEALQVDKWWYPFSMAHEDVAAMRPAKTFGKPHWDSATARLEIREELDAIKKLRH